jgi:hypothetical protein
MLRTSKLLQPIHMLIILLLSGCGTTGIIIGGGGRLPPPNPGPRTSPSYPSYRTLHIPPGHLPPPGQCRVWYPGRPPGQQPPPTSCDQALREAAAGSWVLFRSGDSRNILEVKEKKGNQKSEIISSHYTID